MNTSNSAGKPFCLAIIPARGGSKGIRNKNIAPVGQHPLIAWTIAAAQISRHLNRIILSTDSAAIAKVGQQYGVEVPFLRPADLARDDSPTVSVILHALRALEDCSPDFVIVLQPTSPLRTSRDIDAAIELAMEKEADAVVGVTRAPLHPYWMKQVDAEGRIRSFLELDSRFSRRQDLPPIYAPNGAIYLVRSDVLFDRETFYTDRTYAYPMPPERSLDIDSEWDLRVANLVLADQQPERVPQVGTNASQQVLTR